MNYYQAHQENLGGTRSYRDSIKKANLFFKPISRRTKRQPYVRSAYFNKQKVFFNFFWRHLFDYSQKVRTERLQYLPSAIELIQKSRNNPESKDNPNKKNEILHRFYGLTKEKESFCIQIKEDKRTGSIHLMSIFKWK